MTTELTSAVSSEPVELTTQLLEGLDMGIAVVWPDGRLHLKNREARRLFGVTTSNISARESRSKYRLRRSALPKVSSTIELNAESLRRIPDGAICRLFGPVEDRGVWVRLVVRALKYKGQALVQLNLKDLTEEVEDREHFERMAHVVIHDLKQPLRALLSLPGILQSDCGEALEPSGVELLTRITAAARRLHKQINGLSAYALEYERPLVFGSVSLNSVVHDVVACRIGKLRMADIDVDVGELPSVWGDQTGLRAVIEHLFDHMLGMSSILERRVLKIRWISQGHGRFEISDSSVVIETRHLANIFEVFGMRTDDGSGVRLALCKRVIERHGGEIGARNASDLGAVFWFTLPSIKHGS